MSFVSGLSAPQRRGYAITGQNESK